MARPLSKGLAPFLILYEGLQGPLGFIMSSRAHENDMKVYLLQGIGG